jgi:hypothetical protein
MTRLTEEQITQKARDLLADRCSGDPTFAAQICKGAWDETIQFERTRAAIIATLTEYAPHLLPRDADEERRKELAEEWAKRLLQRPINVSCADIMLGLIKHLDKERGK